MAKLMDKDISVKVISVLFAIVLWLYVASEQNPIEYRNIKDIPVRLTNVEAAEKSSLAIKEGDNYKVNISLKGKRDILMEANMKDIYAEADLRGFTREGVNTVPVEVKGLPANVELVDVEPEHIKVTLESIISVEVPVKVITGGSTRAGYTALVPKITPAQVLVRGPESQLRGVQVVTATLNMTGVAEDVSEVLPVKVVDKDNNEVAGIEISPNIVDVTVPVRKTKNVPVEVVLEGHVAAGKEVSDISQDINYIVLYGEEDVLNSIEKLRTKPVRIWGIESSTYYSTDLVIPQGVWPVNGISTVSVFVDIENVITKQIDIEEIEYADVPEGLQLSEDQSGQDPPVIKVTVEGRESIINTLTAEDIKIYSRLKDMSPGTHTVPLMVELPEGVILKSIQPKEVEVELVSGDRGD